MDVYAENILDHYRHPRNKQTLPNASVTHQEINHSCGDEITVFLGMENDTITMIGWEGTGCAISQAAMSMLGEELEGKTAQEALAMGPVNIHDLLGVPVGPRRFKCALLCLHTVKNAIRKHEGEELQNWLETVGIG